MLQSCFTAVRLIFFLILSIKMFGHQHVKVRGKVYSEESKFPISGASIYIKDTQMGTVSDESGYFELLVSPSYFTKRLTISHVAYQHQNVALDSIDGGLIRIYLKEKTLLLQEVLVTAESARQILEESILKIRDTYPKEYTQMPVYHQEVLKIDTVAIRYLDFAGQIVDRGYSPSRIPEKSNEYKVHYNQIRYSYCSSNFDPTASIGTNSIYHSLKFDFRKYQVSFLNNQLSTKYDYSVDGVSNYKNTQVYKISFSPHQNVEQPFPSGILYIDKNTLAIMAVITQINPDKATYWKPAIYKYGEDTLIQTTNIKSITEYKWENGEVRLDKIYISYKFEILSNPLDKVYHTAEMISILKVVNEDNLKGGRLKKLKKESYLYGKKYTYSASFWKNYKYPIGIQRLTDLKSDLERNGISLEEQFRQGK